MITELVYWFIALLGIALVIMWIDSLLCNGKSFAEFSSGFDLYK